MLAWTALLLACKKDGGSPPDTGIQDSAVPEAAATLELQGVTGIATVNTVKIVLENPEQPEPEPELALEDCQVSAMTDPTQPALLKAGFIIVRLDGKYVDLEQGQAQLNAYPAGAQVWFSADGGREFPAFTVPELLVVPEPLSGMVVSPEGDGLRLEWSSPGDEAVTTVSISTSRQVLTCRVEDDGVFVVDAETLAAFGASEPLLAGVVRTRNVEVITEEVRVRGIARFVELQEL